MIKKIFVDILYYIIFLVSLGLTVFSVYKTRKSKYSENIKLILYGLSLLIYVIIMSLNQIMSLIYDVNSVFDGSNLFTIFTDITRDIPFIISVFVTGLISFMLLLIGLIIFIIKTF